MKCNNFLLRLLRCEILISNQKRKKPENNDNSKVARKYLLQYAATIIACVFITLMGSSISWTSSALLFLESENSEIRVSKSEGSWIVSMWNIGMIAGDLMMPFLSTSMGRKPCLLILALPEIISLILIIFSKNIITIYISRFIAGVVNLLSFCFVSMYIGEIADKSIRGKLLLILSISITFGSAAVKTAGAFLSYRMLNILMLCLPTLFFCTFIFMPESPYYLLLKNREEEALKSLMKLQGTKNREIINSEFERVKNAVEESKKTKNWAFHDLIFIKKNRKSICIVMISIFTLNFSGAGALAAYTQEIFNYSNFSLAPEYCAMILADISLITCTASTAIIDCIGRRKPFLLSGIFSAIGLAMVGLFFFIKFINLEGIITSINWLPLVGLIIRELASSFGIHTIPYVLMGEIFDINVKATALLVVNITSCLSMFLINILFEWINSKYGMYVNFLMYTVCCTIGALLFFFVAPETKGKSLEDIQNILNGRDNNQKDRDIQISHL